LITTGDVVETHPNRRDRSIISSRIWIVTAAAVPAALYLVYVYHYAVNAPFVDDWEYIPIVATALHGHLDVGALWSQWSDAREVTGRLVYIAFGLIDHLNERAVMLFSAVVFIGTYVLVLLLFQAYLGKRLTALPVFVVGVVWFSLVDWQSALWSSLVNNYLVLFFFALAMLLLLTRQKHARLLFGLSVAAAVLASLSFIEGFLVWPIGLICLLWSSKRNKAELATWLAVGTLTAVGYFHGYNSTDPACSAGSERCSLFYGVTHPGQLIHYMVLLVGNILPLSTTGIESHLWVHDLQGAVLLLAAILVVVQTLRKRRAQPNPLPLLFIVFAVAFDLVTAVGRVGAGSQTAVAQINSRYSMPNLILLVGIVIYAWAHIPQVKASSALRVVGFGALMAFLVLQCVVGTVVAVTDGQQFHQGNINGARIMVNLDRVPTSERVCYIDAAVWPGWGVKHVSWFRRAKNSHLSFFQSESEHYYKAEGLPLFVVPSRAVMPAVVVAMAKVCPTPGVQAK